MGVTRRTDKKQHFGNYAIILQTIVIGAHREGFYLQKLKKGSSLKSSEQFFIVYYEQREQLTAIF